MNNKNIKIRAIKFRQTGHSYSEISSMFGISKGSCSLWLKDVTILKKGQIRLEKIRMDARSKALATVKKRVNDRNTEIAISIEKSLKRYIPKTIDQKVLFSLLYWSEGEKNSDRLAFINSDEQMIRLYMKLLRTNFKVKEEKFRAILHLHPYHNSDKMKLHWSRVSGIHRDKISVYNKVNSGKQKKEGYNGCISIRYNNVRLYKEIETLYKQFTKNYLGD